MQQQRLAQEMQDATVVSIIQKRPKMKASRSLPAVLLKPAPKSRVSVCVVSTVADLVSLQVPLAWERNVKI